MSPDIHFQSTLRFDLDGRSYMAHQDGSDPPVPLSGRCLVTVTPVVPANTSLAPFLEAFVAQALATDDVFSVEFLDGILICAEDPGIQVDAATTETLKTWNNSWVRCVGITDAPIPGPFILNNGRLSPAYRVYDDTADAFSLPLRRAGTGDGQLIPLKAGSSNHHARCIAVPSRLRAQPSSSRPLDGLRITIKDMFDIKGLRTSLGSREYLALCPRASATAPAVETLIKAGVEVLGITKMCAMVGIQHPVQCVDFPAPFNPRGDGYQSPSGGNNGQAAAVAAYDWLDIAIGTDSTASGRFSALANGVFALRPSRGMVSREGVWSGVPQVDTPCFFGRDLVQFRPFSDAWYMTHQRLESSHLPRVVAYFVDPLPEEASVQKDIFMAFVSDMAAGMGVVAKPLSLADVWKIQPPSEAKGMTLSGYLNPEISMSTYVYSFWKKIEIFWEDYQERFRKTPFMPPPDGIGLWDKAKNITPEQNSAALERFEVYRKWLLKEVLRTHERNPIVIWPINVVEPNYRDRLQPHQKGEQLLHDPLLLAPILGAPELVVPVGEITYLSRISGREEPLPVCASVMGVPGSDLALIDDVAEQLRKSGRPLKVFTGRSMFSEEASQYKTSADS